MGEKAGTILTVLAVLGVFLIVVAGVLQANMDDTGDEINGTNGFGNAVVDPSGANIP